MAKRPTIRLFSTDLDGTLLGNPEATARFSATWEALPEERRPLLVYNSGRLVDEVNKVVGEQDLPDPDYIIGGVGTEIVDNRRKSVLSDYQNQQFEHWSIHDIEHYMASVPGAVRQPERFQTAYKSSWYLHGAERKQIKRIDRDLAEQGLQVSVVYSSSRDLDIIPKRASKGQALRWLLKHLNLRASSAVVSGDSANDASMYTLRGINGILVENAQPELVESCVKQGAFHARGFMADGIIEGLQHFGVLRDVAEICDLVNPSHHDAEMSRLFDPASLQHLDQAQQSLIGEGYRQAVAAIRRNITEMGFSACSIPDNETTGTDANYHSVWARDGAVVVVGTSAINDPDIRACQRQTLVTLLDAMTPNGQVPANVRIATGEPDYSGVGGICSIDSGIWLVIAVYYYVTATGDREFLERYSDHLRKIMFWLQAHDSNNDGLLEIPEASDWTDLFGRSYQVLYDEVLWCRANVCWARMLEIMEDYDAASSVFRHSQYIQGKLLSTFWPSIHGSSDPHFAHTFADRQYSIGDVHYLLAEVTPFNFSWRCDVYGNVLAFLDNVLDVSRARTAFKFMWGAGVNQPWPVSNLYPVVQFGDPDWRPYYTVNLLNLPGHYHNGGIWPLIGGMWVRFIERLGFHDVACQELVRLTELCRAGIRDEWEFNEWYHGTTGRPMGKAYQAWSASSYIHACQDLGAGLDEVHKSMDTGLYCRFSQGS